MPQFRSTTATAVTAALLAGGLATSGAPAASAASAAAPRYVTVHPGQSVQAAIDRVARGGTVVLRTGRYRENLLVTKPIRLTAAGRVLLEPAARIASNVCTRDPDAPPHFDVGICILGRLGPVPPGGDVPPVLAPVSGVQLDGFEVRGFASAVEALGTRVLVVERMEMDHSGIGLFSEIGAGTVVIGNRVHDNTGSGIEVRQSRDVDLELNSATQNTDGEGITILDTMGGRILGNDLSGNCAGLAVVDTPEPGAAGRLRIADNSVRANNAYCPPAEGRPSESGGGIGLVGTMQVLVEYNRITDNHPLAGRHVQFGGFGLLLFDATPLTGGPAATDNRIVHNTFGGNRPFDVVAATSGTGNVFRANRCTRANVPGICD